MILLHRLTPFALFVTCAAGFGLAMAWPDNPLLPLGFALGLCAILLARLVGWHPRGGLLWNLAGAPWLFFASAAGLFMLVEFESQRLILAAVVSVLIFLFAEQVFAYIHTPVVYQAYAIQHLSLGMNVLTIFFLSAFVFGLRLFLQTPLYILVPIMAAVAGYVMYQTLWVSKMEHARALVYAACGGIVLSEVFLSLVLLPLGFYPNAAILAFAAYVFLGISRASFLGHASRSLITRYLVAGSVLSVAVLVTAQWR